MQKQEIIDNLKPLEWIEQKGGFIAFPETGGYAAWKFRDKIYCTKTGFGGFQYETSSLESAKEICQAHYEQTILTLFNLSE